jgi:predicted SAM-dependent methyltransferase
MRIFRSESKLKREQDAARQKERESRYRAERDEWRRIGKNARDFASRHYLRGQGIEIGGLHNPLPLYEGATAKYVDRLSTEELRRWLSSEEVRRCYPDLGEKAQVTVDIIDDGETLRSIADGSVDFVIANHMLEHTHNPIGTVENFLRVVKPGGMLYMAIPDKRYTFDRDREVTSFAHIRDDYLRKEPWTDRLHYEDWARHVQDFPDQEAIDRYVEKAVAEQENIHFHVWTLTDIVEMFFAMRREFGFRLELEAAIRNGHEVIVLLRKSDGTPVAEEEPAADGAEADNPHNG